MCCIRSHFLETLWTALRRSLAVACSALIIVGASSSAAGVIISGTRHIYPELRREISIQLTNNDQQAPRLVQAWLDQASGGQVPESADVPFSLSPPVFRVDAGKSQVMRLVYTGEPLPADRESLFWLNVLEVPPRVSEVATVLDDSELNYLRFAFRIRTKVFFRPSRLPGKPDDAPGQLQWFAQSTARGIELRVYNPTAYHVTFSQVALVLGASSDAPLLSAEPGMVDPGGTLRLKVRNSLASIPGQALVQFSYINDYGAFSSPQRAALQF